MKPMSFDFSLFHEHERKKSRAGLWQRRAECKGARFHELDKSDWSYLVAEERSNIGRHFRGDALKSQRQQSHVRSWISNPRALCSWIRRRSRSVFAEAPSGCSPGRGCTNEMLRVCLDDHELLQLLFSAREDFARGSVPPTVDRVLMVATMTALQKPDGGEEGVRGIETGMAFRKEARRQDCGISLFPIPIRFVHKSGNRLRCVGHIRALTDANPVLTVTSIDGVGAHDHVYRSAMLSKLLEVPALQGLLPFARFGYGETTTYVWEDEEGVRHRARSLRPKST